MFEKAEEYITRIFYEQSPKNEFNIFATVKDDFSIGGFLQETGEAFSAYKKDNKIGIKVENGKYIYLQTREKFIDAEDFQDVVEHDPVYGEEDFRDKFKDVDYVSIWETDKEAGTTQKLSYLVNRSSYLVTEYFKIYGDYSNLGLTLNDEFLNSRELINLAIADPVIPGFDITNTQGKKIVMLVPEKLHTKYIIKDNNQDMDNVFLRKALIKKIANEALEADKQSHTIVADLEECKDNLQSILQEKFEDSFEGR